MHFLEDRLTSTEKHNLITFCHKQYQSYLRVVRMRVELTSSINIPKKISITNYSSILSILQKIYRAVKDTYPEATLTSLMLEVDNGVSWNNRRVNTFNKTTTEMCALYCGYYTEDIDTIPSMSFVHNNITFQLNDVVVLQGKEELSFNSARQAQDLIYLITLNFNEPVLPWNNEELIYLTDVLSRDQSNNFNIIKQNTIDYSDIENI